MTERQLEPSADSSTTDEEGLADGMATIRASTILKASADVSDASADHSDSIPEIGRPALTSLLPSPPEADPRFTKKRYERVELLGVGGEGRVYSALDRTFRREVAIKVMRSGTVDDVPRRESFIKEARVTALLEHPNILPVYDMDVTDDGRTYFTMRKAQGHTLASLMKQSARPGAPADERLGWDNVVRIMDKVCDAVAYAHSVGYVHQDIKPGNIILGEFGNVLLFDWGTALNREDRDEPRLKVVGTPNYMSPEQVRAESVDERTDVYCIGATLFHLITRKPPITDSDPISLWEKKCRGHIDDVACPEGVPNELVEIAKRAMAHAPADRFQTVTELQQALRDVQRHHQSLELGSAVASRLAAPEPIADYDEATALLARAQGALDLWPENERALRLVAEVRGRHVMLAIETGDLALAERLMASPIADRETLEERLAVARATQRQQRQRARWTAAAIVVALGLLASLAVFLVRDHYLQQANWHDVASYDLTDARQSVHVLRSRERLDETTPLPKEQFTAEGLSLKSGETYWLGDAPNRGDFRIEVRVKWTRSVDGVEVLADAQRAQPPVFWEVPSGLACQFGGWAGTATYFTVQEKGGIPDTSGAVRHEFVPGRWYELAFERRDGRVRLYIDGTVVLEDFMFVPFEGKENRWFSLRAWNQPVIVSRIRLQRLSIPEKASPVISGDSLFRVGMYSDALEQYEMIADDHPASAVEEVGLAKAYLAAQRQGLRSRRLDLLSTLEKQYPSSPYLWRCIEEEAVASWREERYDDALHRISQAFAHKRDSRVAMRILLSHGRDRWPRAAIDALMAWVGRTTDVQRLDLSGLGLRSLDFLRQDRIDELAAEGNRIASLAPLQRIAVKRLKIGDNPISDLTPLRGKSLELLHIWRTKVADLSPISGSGLQTFDATDSSVRDISVLNSLPLTDVKLNGLELHDLEALRGLHLHRLEIDRNSVESLEPLRGMPLERLHVESNRVRSLEPLRGAPLTELWVVDNPLESVAPVADIKGVKILGLGACGVRQLDVLAGKSFERLMLRDNGIRDVSALATVQATFLELDGNEIRDASPLARAHTEWLDLSDNPLVSLGGLVDSPPKNLWVSADHADPRLADELQRKWSATPATRDLAYVADVQLAWNRRDRARLLALRRRVDGHWYLPLYVKQTWDQANATADYLGAHLFWLRDEQHSLHLHDAIPIHGTFWQAYRIGDRELIAPDGHRLRPADVYIQPGVWDHPGSVGVGYDWALAFGTAVTFWPARTAPERHLYQPMLEWDDDQAAP